MWDPGICCMARSTGFFFIMSVYCMSPVRVRTYVYCGDWAGNIAWTRYVLLCIRLQSVVCCFAYKIEIIVIHIHSFYVGRDGEEIVIQSTIHAI